MGNPNVILLLGVYGLAGRAILKRLVDCTSHRVIAAGRDPRKLAAVTAPFAADRVETVVLDVRDHAALHDLCLRSQFVVNAVGPYPRFGADVARVAIAAQCPYLDCANEQSHYRRLVELDGPARTAGVPIVTAAGAIPGLSTLLAAKLLAECPGTERIDCYWGQLRNEYRDTGLASVMGGLIEAADCPLTLVAGELRPFTVGSVFERTTFPAPVREAGVLEFPTIDALILHQYRGLAELHTWISLGEQPVWLLGLVRFLRPHRCALSYQLIAFVTGLLNDRETCHAIELGLAPDAILRVQSETHTVSMHFRNGGEPTACLPVHLVDSWLRGEWKQAGLLSPLDLVAPGAVNEIISDVLANRINK